MKENKFERSIFKKILQFASKIRNKYIGLYIIGRIQQHGIKNKINLIKDQIVRHEKIY